MKTKSSDSKKNQRYRLLADKKIQGILCLRVTVYWFVCQLIVAGSILCLVKLDGANTHGLAAIQKCIPPALIIATAILPLMLYDLIAYSNRFAGPIVNLRRKMDQFVNENKSEVAHLRQSDFLRDIAENYNRMQAHIEHLEDQLQQLRPSESTPEPTQSAEPKASGGSVVISAPSNGITNHAPQSTETI